MNVLLATSAAPHQSPFSTTEKRPPIGLGFLIAVLRNAGHQVFFLDNYLRPSNFLETDYLKRHAIDFVGLYANTICFRDTRRILYRLEYLRQKGDWQGRIIVGGPHTSVALETIPPFVDFVVQGEGEQAVLDIVEGRAADRVIRCRRLENLDELPMPAWDYFIDQPYNWGGDWFPGTPVFTMNTSRGCPFQCTFCSLGSIWGRKYTCFSAARIVADIDYLIKTYGAQGIYFREDNFTVNRQRTEEFCHLLLDKGIKIAWACETRVDSLDRDLLALMRRAGLSALYFGVESGSQKILDLLKKGITPGQTRAAFRWCRELGLNTAASVIVGVPGETLKDLNDTLSLLKEIQPAVTWYNVFVGIPQSPLYRQVIKEQLYEFIDDRGLVYLHGHNQRVKGFYGGRWDADIPVCKNTQGEIEAPQISVVMPVAHPGPDLESAIHSVLQQTFANFEFIIVNDDSTGEAAEILNRFADCRLRVITNPEPLGLTKSLNLGLTAARAPFIAIMEAQDLSLPHRLELQRQFLEDHPDYALVGSSYYRIDAENRLRALVPALTGNENLRAGLREENQFRHGSVMMRKNAVVKLQGYDARFQYAQDYDLWLRLAEVYKIANLEEPLYCWRDLKPALSPSQIKEQEYFARLARKKAEAREDAGEGAALEPATATPPLVSVIVPTHNRPDLLVDTLQSILDQTYPHFEIIVVNDAGVEVGNIVRWLNTRQNITYAKHGRNLGLAAARNTGIKLARGQYIAYLDDNDLFYPQHLETLVKFLENRDFRVAYTDAHRAHQVKQHDRYVTTHLDLPYSHDFDPDRLLVANQFPVLCLMHEKTCLEQAGYFDESLTIHEDWDLWIRLSRHYPFAHLKQVTCEFSWRQDGSTMTSQKAADFVRTLEIIHAKYQDQIADRPHLKVWQQQFLQRQREALRVSATACESGASGGDRLLALATTAMESEDWPAAAKHLRDLTQSFPDLLEAHLSLSDVLTLQGKHQEAAEVLRAARQVDAEALPLLKRQGLNCRQRGDLSGAMAAYTRAWSQTPRDPEILGHLGATCIDLGLFAEAQGYLQDAVRINPRQLDSWLGLARIAQHQGNQEAFETSRRQAGALDPRHPRLLELTQGRIPAKAAAPPPPPAKAPDRPQFPVIQDLSSIIIPVFNNLSLTRQCLESIAENTDSPHEIILVDNGSSDGTRDYLQELEAAGEVRVISNRTNQGFARACNQGGRAAQGEYLVFLNNDTIVQPGWLQELAACARKDDKIGAVGARLLYPDDTIQHAGVVFNDRKLVHHIYKNYDRDHPAVLKEREFQAVTAACMLIRKALFLALGGFDEAYLNGYEDVDLCFQLRERGYKIVYNPRAVIYHLESKTPGRHDRGLDNSRIFKEKWFDKIIMDMDDYHQEDKIVVEILERQGNSDVILVHDGNDNPFWREAVQYRQEGMLEKAEACYLRAMKFNPFDPKKGLIAQELGEVYQILGHHSQAEEMLRLAAALIPKIHRAAPEECGRSAEAF
ncbi:MAG: glycosyltransferase [Thermodesulfobacteriota bacterium]